MITGELKNKIDRIWEIFWTGGITNPLEVIEQFTYLLFIKDLDDNETLNESNTELTAAKLKKTFPESKQYLRWSRFKNEEAGQLYKIVSEGVFPFIKNVYGNRSSAYSKYMSDAIFKIPTDLMLSKIVDAIDKLDLGVGDVEGDLYEYLLSKVSTSGTNGQFRTPRHIIKMITELMKPTPEDIIVDPAMGTAGFLVGAEEYLRNNYSDLFSISRLKDHFDNKMFNGFDIDRTMLRIGAMNMMLHGVDIPNIEYRDSLSKKNRDIGKYTLVMTNPPFKGSLDYQAVSGDLLKITKTKKTELLFLALFLRILKIGGRCASIVPEGVLFGSTKGHKEVRKEIIDNNKLKAVISMPSGVFKPYAGVSTAVLIFIKTGSGGTDKVWFYDMKSDGFSLDDKRRPVANNDIPDIIARFNNLEGETDRKRTDQSFFVPVYEIRENDYDLSINRYREVEYKEVHYDEPKVILDRVKRLEKEISDGIDELSKMID
ncbi:N-6 DNA methylase [Clostridium sp. MT-14]|uniref:site-specific DNA-methyltransferase (adenine-specific) n=1 Tax=Clostridium aromativorans TaxID=2836848 RepID=A0ABS8N445_9CLOT|nr:MULTISPECIES: class I SAM-dependent DNA methyltransferase [Clostridium]KAA8680143.1 SAM-dependent DNA methyltransferase [Clostridium sp. HV4-5-A1G]MCC9294563.1 type I restriction-modification system subunit M [Clostridium aromativorans]